MKLINDLPIDHDLGDILSVTCTFCGVPIDTYLSGQQTIDLIHDLNLLLKKRRQILVLPDSSGNFS